MDTERRLCQMIRQAMDLKLPALSLSTDAAVMDAISPEGLVALLAVPPDQQLGEYALPCFRFAKPLRMSPNQIAEILVEAINADEDNLSVASARATGGYVNFFLNRAAFAEKTVARVLHEGAQYGAGDEGEGKTVCIDYSSINIAKRFHIGHLSTTVIGAALKNIYSFLGWRTVGINHLGDWGTQFGKMIAAYKRWGSAEMIEQGGVDALTKLYVRFHDEAEKNPALEDEGRRWFRLIEDNDPEAMAIFESFKTLTLRDAARVYDQLGVSFDSYDGESFYNDKMDRVVDELRDKGLLVESQGAQVVDLEADNMPPCLILKSDGATLYATRDLAAALYRKDHYAFDKCLYVVAYQQDLHFRQLFKVLELMGYDWAKEQMEHVSFGMWSYEGKALSTRGGHIVYLEDLLKRAQERAFEIMQDKSPDLADAAQVAHDVGVGAVVFAALINNRIKDVDFSWERALSFDGETGPYVQYTFARCQSVIRKADDLTGVSPDYTALSDDEAQALLRLIDRFPAVIREACLRNEPSIVTRATLEIAKLYNKYYYEHRILGDDPAASQARLMLTRATAQVIQTGLSLIGLKTPERM